LGEAVTRFEATKLLVSRLTGQPVVASLGHPKYDLFSAGDRPQNFYTWGSMGLASSIGLGLALARPELRTVVLDGDGSLLMNLGSLATIGDTAPANLVLIVWDNAMHATTGRQPTATARRADLAAIAQGAGVEHAVTVRQPEEFEAVVAEALSSAGPWVIVAKVEEAPPPHKPPLDPVFIKQRFMAAIGTPEASVTGG
jgi:thiamine pyrophosphate-dependent acetolactate synthase large subunit-like protein